MKLSNITPQDILKKELAEARASISKWRRYATDADKEVGETKELVKKYTAIYTTLTHILIRSNPFRLNCPTCNMSTYVYLMVNHDDGTSHIQEVAGCFCPYCGERVAFVVKKEKEKK